MKGTRRWLFGIGVALLFLAVVRFLWPVQASFLGTSVSCGNSFGLVGGADNHLDSVTWSVCSGSLHTAMSETLLLLAVGLMLVVGSRQSAKRSALVRPAPGWYQAPWDSSAKAWWDGFRWWPPSPPSPPA